jgi:hypothetical protein
MTKGYIGSLTLLLALVAPLSALTMPETAPAAKTWWLRLHSSTVAQSLTDAAEEPRSLVTTYYQAEWGWQPSSWFGFQTELEGGHVVESGTPSILD